MTDNENKHLFCQNLSRSFIGEHILMSATHTYQMCHWGLGQMLNKFDAQSNLKEGKKGEDCRTSINKIVGSRNAKWVRDLWQPY